MAEGTMDSSKGFDVISEASVQQTSDPQANAIDSNITNGQPLINKDTGKSFHHSGNEILEPPSEAIGISQPNAMADVPYSVFTVSQKRMIVLTGSMASLFSPMSTSIYYPSLSQIAKDLHVSDTKISLTVTLFLVFDTHSIFCVESD